MATPLDTAKELLSTAIIGLCAAQTRNFQARVDGYKATNRAIEALIAIAKAEGAREENARLLALRADSDELAKKYGTNVPIVVDLFDAE